MQIAEFLGQYANSLANASAASGKTNGTATQNLTSGFSQLQEGTIFEGSINSINGSKILLGLSNGQTVSARLEGDIQLMLGQSLFFQVKSNENGTIAIKPYTGDMYNPTIQKALDAAGMEMSGDTLEMVNKMMQEGMPIDKASLSSMRQTLLQNPQVSMQTAIEMTRLNIPVTPQLAAQFENYQNDQHAMLTQMHEVMDELPSVFGKNSADVGELMRLNNEVVKILMDGMPEQEAEPVFIEGKQEAAQLQQQPQLQPQPQTQPLQQQETAQPLPETGTPENQNPQAETIERLPQTDRPVSELLGKQQLANLETQLKQVFPEMEHAKLNTQLGAKELLDAIASRLQTQQPTDKDALARLFSGKEYHELLKDVMEEQWLVKPEDLKTEHKVEELYEKLNRQMGQIEQLAKHTGIQSGSLSQAASEVRSNIDFMNQINQVYTYVQIPLKMANQNAHSDLYVYTNKRNLQNREGELSAFLHLELDHLGTTDVSVKMIDKSVSTKFYLSDDLSYELLEKNMPQLEERLKALGYNCTITMENREEKIDFVEDFLQKSDQGKGGAAARGMVHRYSFDVRA